jgi:hypothetical protein
MNGRGFSLLGTSSPSGFSNIHAFVNKHSRDNPSNSASSLFPFRSNVSRAPGVQSLSGRCRGDSRWVAILGGAIREGFATVLERQFVGMYWE